MHRVALSNEDALAILVRDDSVVPIGVTLEGTEEQCSREIITIGAWLDPCERVVHLQHFEYAADGLAHRLLRDAELLGDLLVVPRVGWVCGKELDDGSCQFVEIKSLCAGAFGRVLLGCAFLSRWFRHNGLVNVCMR